MFSVLHVIDGLPVDADEFGQAFLGKAGLQPSFPDVLPDHPQDLTVCHPLFETTFIMVLTSNIFDVSSVLFITAEVPAPAPGWVASASGSRCGGKTSAG